MSSTDSYSKRKITNLLIHLKLTLKRIINYGATIGLVNPLLKVILRLESFFNFLSNKLIKVLYADSQMQPEVCKKISKTIQNGVTLDKNSIFANKKIMKFGYKMPRSFSSYICDSLYINNNSILPEKLLNNRFLAKEFADLLGLKHARIIEVKSNIEDLVPIDNTVLKPSEFSHKIGVFKISNKDSIISIYENNMIITWNEMIEIIKTKYVEIGNPNIKWIYEEFIPNESNCIPNDIKVYSFYGEIAFVLEIQRYPTVKYCYYDSNCNVIKIDLYKDTFGGTGINHQLINIAQKVSLQIPTPFVRIDFLKTNSELYLCEFTSTPGSTGFYKKNTDFTLGNYYLNARMRLREDLIMGKQFELYKKTINIINKKI